MTVSFFCYNHFTLYSAYTYASFLKKELSISSILIWRNTIFELPKNIGAIWDDVVQIDLASGSKSGSSGVCGSLKRITRIRRIIKDTLFSCTCFRTSSALLVFKDNGLYDTEVIRLFKRLRNGKVVLIEEGIGLYQSQTRTNSIKQVAQVLLGVPRQAHRTQGENDLVDIVICAKPDLLQSHKKRGKIILKRSNLFSEVLVKAYVRDFLGLAQIPDEKADFLYFGQPLSEDGILKDYEEIEHISDFITSLDPGTDIKVKLHPRERSSKYESIIEKHRNVSFLDSRLQSMPAEVVFKLLGSPVVVTPFSSAAVNILQMGGVTSLLLLYRMFGLSQERKSSLDALFSDMSEYVIDSYDTLKDGFRTPPGVIENEPSNEYFYEMEKLLEFI
ncbi:MAG TPA: polysialyltransferase family glycosyltransferase [Saccharofermentans sp.]|nr:polysialyltransferase family glycosyltransferase [Saccharofermentans sp.]